MATTWHPMGMDPDEYNALHEDIPDWLARSLGIWLDLALGDRNSRISGREYDMALLLKCERKLRLPGFPDDVVQHGTSVLLTNYDDETVLRVVDFLVHDSPSGTAATQLKTILKESGSAWTVGTRNGVAGLERRVPAGVQEAAESVMAQAGDAGNLLSEAWHAAFGLRPNPSQAYILAIRAVESAAAPVVTPKDKGARLGKIVNVIRDQGDWSLNFGEDDAEYPSGTTLLAMLRTLAAGQTDRHVGPPVTQEAAEAAVMMAVPLVQWFTSGAVQRRTTP